MKIVHLSTSDRNGGAAIAAYRLNDAINRINKEDLSELLVRDKTSSSEYVIGIDDKSTIYRFIKKLATIISSRVTQSLLKPFGTFSIDKGYYRLSKHSLIKEADIIYLHWCNNGLLNIKETTRILKLGKPTYIFLHDMWYLTGGCHHSLGCKGFENDCKRCPLIGDSRLSRVSKRMLKQKSKLSKFKNLTMISPSHWMDKQVEVSSIFKNSKHVVIPNILPSEIFKPIDQYKAREILNLPQDKKLIMFMAVGGTDNPYKGWQELKDALCQLNLDLTPELMVIGNNVSKKDQEMIGLKIHSFGKIQDEISLPLLYSAADLFVTPSLAESFSQVSAEAQSCGCPVVGFKIGGIPDVIVEKERANLVEPKDSKALAAKISEVLCHSERLDERIYRHNEMERKFGESQIIDQHKALWIQNS